jgi:peptide/nickel transport system permease protein
VWTYILRRLLVMIPTLLGVTIVSFLIMQLAPGDPLRAQLSPAGMAKQSGQNREAYLIQRQDLMLDKPLVLNFDYFRDFGPSVCLASHFLGIGEKQIAQELESLARRPDEPQATATVGFLRSLRIPDFDARFRDPQKRPELVHAVQTAVGLYLDDLGRHGAAPAMAILSGADSAIPLSLRERVGVRGSSIDETSSRHTTGVAVTPGVAAGANAAAPVSPGGHAGRLANHLRDGEGAVYVIGTSREETIGAIHALNHMVPDPVKYTYSHNPSNADTAEVTAVWSRWWDQVQESERGRASRKEPPEYPPLSGQRQLALQERFAAMLDAPSRAEMYRRMEFFDAARFESFQQADLRFFLKKLLDGPSLRARVVASTVLAGYVGRPLSMDVADSASPPEVAQTADNWQLHYRYRRDDYQPGFWRKCWYIVADTQYAHLVVRLATFHFGRSALRTREPVAGRIWNAVLVSAPIMLLSEALIYLVAVPLGILCAVGRGRWIDRAISLGLFLLYSVPAFVAGMLFLVFFCYGDYLRLFPMTGLHSEAAAGYDFPRYALDYLWHIVLPVVCLALFSLAGMAMYARSSLLDVLGQDYIRTARAKGLAESKVILKHALRNSMIPVITLFASFLPAMLGGSVLVESIFGIPGMGYLSWQSILQKDIPTLMAMTYLDAIVVLVSLLLTDLLYVLVDPRISFASGQQ